LFFLFVGLQSIRHSSSVIEKNDFVVLYVLGNIKAFETIEPASSLHFGENSFRVIYAVSHSLGISDTKPIHFLLPFIEKPIITNTYTAMYPFFKDFGYWGIGIFAIFLGTLFGWIFKKAKKGNILFILLYASFTTVIIMQYVADTFFTNMAGHIKFIIILLIPFMATKYKWLATKE